MDQDKLRFYGVSKAYQKRWDKVQEQRTSLYTNLLEAEAIWGAELKKVFEKAFTLEHELFTNIRCYLEVINPDTVQGRKEANERILRERRDIMYDNLSEEEDDFKKNLLKIVEDIESYLKPKLGHEYVLNQITGPGILLIHELYVKGDKLKYLIIAILTFFLAVGCASKPINLDISNNYTINGLMKVTRVIKSGDFIAVIGENKSKLAITENQGLDFGPEKKYDSKIFFSSLYQENEDKTTVFGKDVNEFRIGLQIDGYISKSKEEKNQSTVYLWLLENNKLVAIVSDNADGYFLNIIGENIDPSKILHIIK